MPHGRCDNPALIAVGIGAPLLDRLRSPTLLTMTVSGQRCVAATIGGNGSVVITPESNDATPNTLADAIGAGPPAEAMANLASTEH